MNSSTIRYVSPYVKAILGIWLYVGMSLSNAQAVPLEQVQRVLIETVALTEKGLQDSTSLRQVVTERLAQAGFTPLNEATKSYDVVVRVKCEERKTWTGLRKQRKSSDVLSTGSRLWKGPACRISYRHQGKTATWSWEVRTSFEQPREAAKAVGATNIGLYALQELNTQLAQDGFPLYLAAEWRQTERLINLFEQTEDQPDARRLILRLLGPLPSPAALSTIQKAAQDSDLALTAIAALGDQGEVAIPVLVMLLKTPDDPERRLAALRALGEIATHNKTSALYEQFVGFLQSDDLRMQTVAVRGLGKLGDQRAISPLETLNVQAWTNPSTNADIQELREALNWSLWQLNPDAHTGE